MLSFNYTRIVFLIVAMLSCSSIASARFLSQDPLGYEGGDVNLYRYVGNDPMNYVDPFGLYESQSYLRWVPGQHLFDQGMTAVENRSYGMATSYFAGMLGEQTLFVLTLGQSSTARGAATACEMSLTKNAAREAINISESRLAHVLARHFPGGAQAAGKSIFNASETVPGLIRAAESVSPVLQRGGNFQRIVDAGRAIGIDRATGQSTTIYTVITDTAGNLVTMFPGIP